MNNQNTNDRRFKCKKCTWQIHHIRDCRNQSQHDETNFSEKNNITENFFYSCLNTQQGSKDLWDLDSGCSNHMIGNKNSFIKLDENIKSNIALGDGRTQEVGGKGMIAIKAKNGTRKFIQDVLYIPGLAKILLSVGQLIQEVIQ